MVRTIGILIRKELDSAFNSWAIYTGYLLFFCICGFACWLSPGNVFTLGQAGMTPFFTVINWIAFFIIHALAMKSVADERRSGTLELLLTKPVTTFQLIAGKFCSYLIIIGIALFLTLPYYFTMTGLGSMDHGAVLLGYFGLILTSACYISIGLFASSAAKTPISAFFISLGTGLCFQVLFGLLANQIPFGPVANLFGFLSLPEHFESLNRGVLDTRDLFYFLSVIVLFLALAKLYINKYRH
ncbi:MAG: ABC transporter permease [Culturomica sp.]|jgi:ABC-2 type transport system permease protein|nr:ABC transporter permease [Culturomica sp.]